MILRLTRFQRYFKKELYQKRKLIELYSTEQSYIDSLDAMLFLESNI